MSVNTELVLPMNWSFDMGEKIMQDWILYMETVKLTRLLKFSHTLYLGSYEHQHPLLCR